MPEEQRFVSLKKPEPYNMPWSWYIDSEDISMADFTAEIYDGLPSHLEGNLDYWLDTVGRFAP